LCEGRHQATPISVKGKKGETMIIAGIFLVIFAIAGFVILNDGKADKEYNRRQALWNKY
jgi:hypothetical protein